MGLMDQLGGLAGAGGIADILKKAEAGQHEQIDHAQAVSAFQHVAGKLPPNDLREVATNAIGSMSPSQQQELSQQLAPHAGGQAPQGADGIAGMLTQLVQGGNLGALGGSQNPVVKMALTAIAGYAMKRLASGGLGGLGSMLGR